MERMSENDLIYSKGKALDEYQKCRDRLGVLQADAKRFAVVLDKVIVFLRGGKQDSESLALGIIVGSDDVLSEKLKTLLNDLRETRQEYANLRCSLIDMGVDLKD
jgi:hypothetical protein